MNLPVSVNSPVLLPGFIFGGTGTGEILIIFVVALLLFGPRRLPELARVIGRILSQIRNASNDFRTEIMRIEEEQPVRRDSVDVQAEEIGVKAGSSGSLTETETEEGAGGGGSPE